MRLLLIAVLVALSVLPARADEASVLRDAGYLFDTTMSPYCPGRTLSACPSEDARALREEITLSLQAGSSVADEQTRMVNRFGPAVLGRPVGKVGVWSWGVPLLFVIVGLLVIRYVAGRRTKGAVGAQTNFSVEESSARSKIEAEIRERMQ